ncbi:MAG: glycosyltransferase [Planctomycetota bacterium]
MKIAYLLKKFPRLSETFILGEVLRQEACGQDLHIFSRRTPDDEPRHESLAGLRAEVEILPQARTLNPFRDLLDPALGQDLLARLAPVVGPWASAGHDRLDGLVAEALHVLRRCQELDIEHIHTHFATDSAIVAHLVHGLGGPTYSITAHAKDIYRSTVSPALLSHLVAASAFTVTVCDANVQHLASTLTAEAMQKVRRLYNGIDLSDFAFEGEGRDAAHILSVGRLVEKKGLDLLLLALADLRDRGMAFEASIIGDGEERPKLEYMVRELALENHVQLLGAQSQAAVREAMSRATLFALPCRVGNDGNRDALPTVLLEALAVGLPCVSTPVTGIPEILDHGRVGALVPEDDVQSLSAALRALLADPAGRADMARAGRAWAQRQFDGNQAARTLAGWFAECSVQEPVR